MLAGAGRQALEAEGRSGERKVNCLWSASGVFLSWMPTGEKAGEARFAGLRFAKEGLGRLPRLYALTLPWMGLEESWPELDELRGLLQRTGERSMEQRTPREAGALRKLGEGEGSSEERLPFSSKKSFLLREEVLKLS